MTDLPDEGQMLRQPGWTYDPDIAGFRDGSGRPVRGKSSGNDGDTSSQANTELPSELAPKPHPSNTEQLDENFGDWLEANGCLYIGITGNNEYPIEYDIDLNKLKAAIITLLATHTAEAVRAAREDELHLVNEAGYVSRGYLGKRLAQLKHQGAINE